ncbi:interleukin-1 alpha [Sorex araneus]|uniref:interleukin-1 alpha n=1 Tax=Sorex araneus TaxID=42254 RepID=UPI002433A574|nr:interleukin-1 alpha [Sorex araneus]
MAKVPDLFEDLKNCYSENEEFSSEVEHLSQTQKSFYDASYGPLHENHFDKYMSLSTSENLKTSKLTLKKSMVMVETHGKILKKRRLSFNQFLTDEDLEVIANASGSSHYLPEEEIQPRSVSYELRSNVKYKFITTKGQCTLKDSLNQSIIQEDKYLRATALQDLNAEVKFDMGTYLADDDSEIPVTLRISKTQLFVSAQNEDEPVLLKEFLETPKTIRDETNILFIRENSGSVSYFKSVAYPDLYIATKQDHFVHMAKGPPSITDFFVWES